MTLSNLANSANSAETPMAINQFCFCHRLTPPPDDMPRAAALHAALGRILPPGEGHDHEDAGQEKDRGKQKPSGEGGARPHH